MVDDHQKVKYCVEFENREPYDSTDACSKITKKMAIARIRSTGNGNVFELLPFSASATKFEMALTSKTMDSFSVSLLY
jgi:hypothetical protein